MITRYIRRSLVVTTIALAATLGNISIAGTSQATPTSTDTDIGSSSEDLTFLARREFDCPISSAGWHTDCREGSTLSVPSGKWYCIGVRGSDGVPVKFEFEEFNNGAWVERGVTAWLTANSDPQFRCQKGHGNAYRVNAKAQSGVITLDGTAKTIPNSQCDSDPNVHCKEQS